MSLDVEMVGRAYVVWVRARFSWLSFSLANFSEDGLYFLASKGKGKGRRRRKREGKKRRRSERELWVGGRLVLCGFLFWLLVPVVGS
jgi:hypothetical protein